MPETGGAWRVPLAVAGIAALCWILYQTAPPAIAGWAIFPYAACLVLGPSLVYPALRRRGVPAARAVAGGLALPLLWLAKEGYRVTAVFSPAEALYYSLSPISLGLFGAAAAQMAVAELVIARRRSGRWRLAGGAGATLAALALLAAAAGAVGRESGGREIFYGYIALYRILFPGGSPSP